MEGSIWIEREGELEGKEGEGQARGHWEWRGGRKGNKERAKQGVTGSGEGEGWGHGEWRGGRKGSRGVERGNWKGNKERAKQGVTGSGEGELEGKELLTEYCNAYLMRM